MERKDKRGNFPTNVSGERDEFKMESKSAADVLMIDWQDESGTKFQYLSFSVKQDPTTC